LLLLNKTRDESISSCRDISTSHSIERVLSYAKVCQSVPNMFLFQFLLLCFWHRRHWIFPKWTGCFSRRQLFFVHFSLESLRNRAERSRSKNGLTSTMNLGDRDHNTSYVINACSIFTLVVAFSSAYVRKTYHK